MAIEIRQVTVTSLVSGQEDQEAASALRQEFDKARGEILAECKQMLRELIRSERER